MPSWKSARRSGAIAKVGELVLFEQRGGIAVLTLNRADKRNALNIALWTELESHIEQSRLAG